MIAVPTLLVLKQPDLGTAFILLSMGIIILFVAGVQWWKFAICFVIFISSLPFVWKYGLHDYQRKRVEIFLNPEASSLNEGYNIMQSRIAIGSGGFFGKGYLQGTQNQLSFLPERQTDFVFTTYAEERGFVGGVFVICLYFAIITYASWISFKSRNMFDKIISFGSCFILFAHSFINIGMVMGILPVVGVPLPLMSYGGTIVLISLVLLSFLLNIDMRT